MKTTLLSTLLTASLAYADTVRFQHWNLRYDSKNDGVSINDTINSLSQSLPNETSISWYKDYTEETWSKRRIGVANDVIFNKADIFTVNEALNRQVTDLQTLLTTLGDGEQWDYIGVGREDGKQKGEYQAIFYNKQKISVVDYYTIWLSNTPFEPSIYPGAGSYRSATIGHFKINSTGEKFTVINTHLDDKSDDQRKLGASLLRHLGGYEYINSDGPVFLTSDFNSHSTGSDDGGYQIAIGGESLVSINQTFATKFDSSIAKTFTWSDFLIKTDAKNRLGHVTTFPGFKAIGDTSGFSGRIDFQFGGNPNSNSKDVPVKSFEVLRHKVGEIFYDNEWHLSDHRPLISDVQF